MGNNGSTRSSVRPKRVESLRNHYDIFMKLCDLRNDRKTDSMQICPTASRVWTLSNLRFFKAHTGTAPSERPPGGKQSREGTMVQANQESRRTTRSSICLFACTAHSSDCSALPTFLVFRCAHLFTCSHTHSLPSSWENELLDVSALGCSKPQCAGEKREPREGKERKLGKIRLRCG